MYEIALYVTLAFGILPLAIFYGSKKAAFSDRAKAFLPYLYLTALASIYEMLGSVAAGIDVTWWLMAYALLEFASLSYFFLKVLPHRLRWILILLGVIFLAEYVAFLSFGEADKQLLINGILICTTFCLVATGVLYYFIQRFKDLQSGNAIPDWTVFCFMSGTLLYYCATFFLFVLADSMFSDDPGTLHNYWVINIIATLLFRGILILGIWKK